MTVFHWILLAAAVFFLIVFGLVLVQNLLKKGLTDHAVPKGNINKAVIYSFTGAMSPKKKESAYLHLPTYAAGMIFHLGTFFGFFWLILLFIDIEFVSWVLIVSALILVITAACGVSILIKRITTKNLRALSNPDDYFSNILVTGFQFLMAAALVWSTIVPVLFVYGSFLLLYIPFGKLRHTIYFFSSRIHLGRYYGKRGVWPVKQND